MKNHGSVILIGFLTIGAACGCGAHEGSPSEAGSNDGTGTAAGLDSGRSGSLRTAPSSYDHHSARDRRDYRGTAAPRGPATDSCCGGVEAEMDATVYVSPIGSDDAAGTHDAPVLTLAHAIRLAADRGHSVAVRP